MSPPFRIVKHLSGQRVRVPGSRYGEIVSVLYEGDTIVELKIRLDRQILVHRYLASECFIVMPRIEDA